ncbi:LOW QUALITY PROTEIN: hypothetical protein V2J09_003829 [Rumex salicifolius]
MASLRPSTPRGRSDFRRHDSCIPNFNPSYPVTGTRVLSYPLPLLTWPFISPLGILRNRDKLWCRIEGVQHSLYFSPNSGLLKLKNKQLDIVLDQIHLFWKARSDAMIDGDRNT